MGTTTKKVNWISGIHLWGWPTKNRNGKLSGWDADFGEMVAYNGKLVPRSEYIRLTKEIHQIN